MVVNAILPKSACTGLLTSGNGMISVFVGDCVTPIETYFHVLVHLTERFKTNRNINQSMQY